MASPGSESKSRNRISRTSTMILVSHRNAQLSIEAHHLEHDETEAKQSCRQEGAAVVASLCSCGVHSLLALVEFLFRIVCLSWRLLAVSPRILPILC